MSRLILVLTFIGLSATCHAQQAKPVCGAKAYVEGAFSGSRVPANPCLDSSLTDADHTPVGLRYSLELLKPTGEALHVPKTYVFHSGDRVRLRFRSTVVGRITMIQIHDDGSAKVLFPDPRIRGGENRIQPRIDAVLPSEESWLQFDDQAGEERLAVYFTPHRQSTGFESIIAGANLDAEAMNRLASQMTGQKNILVEVDDSGPQPAVYAVIAGSERNASSGASDLITLDIILHHQP